MLLLQLRVYSGFFQSGVSRNKSTASASNTRLYSTPLPLLSTTAYPSSTFSSTAHFYNEHVTESSTDEETSSDDYFNENNYVRILNNYRKVVDEEVSRTEGSAPEVTVPIKEKSKEAAKKTEEAPKDGKESLKEGLNKRSGEAEAPKDGNLVKDAVKDMKDPKRSGETKVANNRMELKENLMKTVQGKVPKPAGINKNLYKKTGGDGTPRKPLDELRRTTEQYVSVATTEYFDTEEERKSLEELSSKVAEGVKKGESNELPKGNAEKVKAGVPAPTPTTINLHSKTSENIINSIRNIMNNTHHLKQGLSEIHDAQIIVKADPKVGKKDAKTPEAKTSEAPTKINEASAKINEASPTALERLDNTIVARSGEDEKTRLRNTKVLEPTENDARAMPENLSAAFPWSWAKDILLEKPVAKKTAPNVEDIIAETTDSV